MITRLYLVLGEDGEHHLVDAGSVAQAIRHVTANRFSATVPSAKQVAELMSNGMTVQKANGSTEPSEP